MRKLLIAALLLAPLPAFAHSGAGEAHGLVAGFLHPLGGLDHLVAMVAVGIWAGLMQGRARWLVPATFVGGMAAGGLLGTGGIDLPMAEAGIIASVIILGALIAVAARLPATLAMVLAGLFGLMHGHAHGVDLAGSGLAYFPAMLAATAMLHGAGLMLASRAATRGGEVALRLATGGVSAAAAMGALLIPLW
jgi:urease accessory protein